jgi:glycerol-3-phosphate dehydrogenase (NAD(P)+)
VTKVAVIGAGSWGTTYAKVLCDAGTEVALWARRPELVEAIRTTGENPDYLPGVALPASLFVTGDPAEALAGAEIVAFALPSQTLRENLSAIRGDVARQATLVSLMKGVEVGTDKRMSEVIAEVADVPLEQVVVVTGPNLAREIAACQPTATVVAGLDADRTQDVQRASTNAYFRPYTNSDVVGCELGGAVKNVIALACGVAAGLGYGDNTVATLMTRGLAETARLGAALGADPLTFSGLAGLGDLAATCMSPLSRNRGFGERLGKGMSVQDAIAQTTQTAEAVKSCRSILDLAQKHDVEMPITAGVVRVVYGGMSVGEMTLRLMSRELKPE